MDLNLFQPPLESLATVEETVVRDKAVESLRYILNVLLSLQSTLMKNNMLLSTLALKDNIVCLKEIK
jgi:hypothetical protein